MDNPDDYTTNVLIAKINSVKILSQMLKAISFKDHAMVCVTSNGFKVTVEDAKSCQACAFIQADIFEEFYLKEDIVTFKINLTVLLDCLNLFGTRIYPTTQLKLCYAGHGSNVVLRLMEEGVLTICELVTREPDDMLDFSFTNDSIVNKIIFQSECMKEVFINLDPSSDVIELLLSPDPPHFRISTIGNSTTFHMDTPKNSDIIDSFQCRKTQVLQYKTHLIKYCSKALSLSQETSIRTDGRGFLCFQFQIHADDGNCCFIDHYVSPQEDNEFNSDPEN